MQFSDKDISRTATFLITSEIKKNLNLLTVIAIQRVSHIVVETTFNEEIRRAIYVLKSKAVSVKKTFRGSGMIKIPKLEGSGRFSKFCDGR